MKHYMDCRRYDGEESFCIVKIIKGVSNSRKSDRKKKCGFWFEMYVFINWFESV